MPIQKTCAEISAKHKNLSDAWGDASDIYNQYYKTDKSHDDIAKLYRVSTQTIRHIIRCYKDENPSPNGKAEINGE